MSHLNFNFSNVVDKFVREEELDHIQSQVTLADKELREGTGPGNDFLGWIDLPENYDKDEYVRIKEAAEKIRSNSKALIVIGIGGSYLGSRAAIDFLSHSFVDQLDDEERNAPKIFYAGNNISSTYLADLVEIVKDMDFSIIASDYEGFSLAAVESLSKGIPLLSTRVGIVPELIEEYGVGYLFDKDCENGLSDLIDKIMSGALEIPMPENCRKSIVDYDEPRAMQDFFDKLLFVLSN